MRLQPDPSPFSAYMNEIESLASSSAIEETNFYETARGDVMRHLPANDASVLRYQELITFDDDFLRSIVYPLTNPPLPHTVTVNSYQPSAFARSVLHLTGSSCSYPTPPPALSSSLCHALDYEHATKYSAAESEEFFNSFLRDQGHLTNGQSPITPNHLLKPPLSNPTAESLPAQSSPDPLDLLSVVTPSKRKAINQPKARSIKRMSSFSSVNTPSSITPAQTTPSTSRTSFYGSSTGKARQVYIQLDKQPSLSRLSLHRNSRANEDQDDQDDLNGYSPAEMGISSMIGSSSRRTGDRDKRGIFTLFTLYIEAHQITSARSIREVFKLIRGNFRS